MAMDLALYEIASKLCAAENGNYQLMPSGHLSFDRDFPHHFMAPPPLYISLASYKCL